MKTVVSLLLSIALSFSLCACTKTPEIIFAPEEKQIKSICDLATLKCYYHNVAKYNKTAGEGVLHLFEKDREVWIEYTGYAKIGIDMTKVSMKVEGTEVTIAIPEAKVLNVDADETSMVFYISEDGKLNHNEISPEEETQALADAQNAMKESASSNSMLMLNAQEQAKELIENYIEQLAVSAGVTYHITWISVDSAQ